MRISDGILALLLFAAGSGSAAESIAGVLVPHQAPAPAVTLNFRKGSNGLVVDFVRNHLGVTYSVANFRAAPDSKIRQVILREFKRCTSRNYIPANNADRDYMEDVAGCINTGIDSRKDDDFFLG